MPKSLFTTLLIPPPEKALDREAALSWLSHNLPEYESLVAYMLRCLLQELEGDTPADEKLDKVQFRAAALYLLQRDVQTMAWACSGVLGGLPPVVNEQGREVEGIDDFQGTIVSALRLLVAEAGVVDPASGAFLELSTALALWQAREGEAAGE
jgi:hypothetical protein